MVFDYTNERNTGSAIGAVAGGYIGNWFNLVIYLSFVLTYIYITILLVPELLKKAIVGIKKHGWKKFPKDFINLSYGSNVFELILLGTLLSLGLCWFIYNFFDYRLYEIKDFFSSFHNSSCGTIEQ